MNRQQSNQPSVPQPHDRFFHISMENDHLAYAFFNWCLPRAVKQHCPLKVIEKKDRVFVDEHNFQKLINDALFVSPQNNHQLHLYLLLEHKSYKQADVALYIRRAQLALMEDHKTDTEDGFRVPPVYPILLYHGKQPYRHPITLSRAVDAPAELVKMIFPDPPIQLIDLAKLDLERASLESPYLAVFFIALKLVFTKDFHKTLKLLFVRLDQLLQQPDGLRYLETTLFYIYNVVNRQKRREVIQMATTQLPEPARRYAWSLDEQRDIIKELRGTLDQTQSKLNLATQEKQRIQQKMKADLLKQLDEFKQLLEQGNISATTYQSLAKPVQLRLAQWQETQ